MTIVIRMASQSAGLDTQMTSFNLDNIKSNKSLHSGCRWSLYCMTFSLDTGICFYICKQINGLHLYALHHKPHFPIHPHVHAALHRPRLTYVHTYTTGAMWGKASYLRNVYMWTVEARDRTTDMQTAALSPESQPPLNLVSLLYGLIVCFKQAFFICLSYLTRLRIINASFHRCLSSWLRCTFVAHQCHV